MIRFMGTNNVVGEGVCFEGDAEIGHCSVVGYGNEKGCVRIGDGFVMGAFSMIENAVTIGNHCEIGNYCTIYSDANIGNNVRILSGSRVYWDASIGDNAIINGYVSQNVKIGNNVRFFGRIAHSHRNHLLDWETTSEEGPSFDDECFIGIGALIVGAVSIGKRSYIAAGEVVRYCVPPDSVVYKGSIYPKSAFRGLII